MVLLLLYCFLLLQIEKESPERGRKFLFKENPLEKLNGRLKKKAPRGDGNISRLSKKLREVQRLIKKAPTGD